MSYKRTHIDHSQRLTVDLHGRIIATFRQAMGLSQKELAERVGVSESYIEKLESGERKVPSAKVVNKIGDELNLDFNLNYRLLE